MGRMPSHMIAYATISSKLPSLNLWTRSAEPDAVNHQFIQFKVHNVVLHKVYDVCVK